MLTLIFLKLLGYSGSLIEKIGISFIVKKLDPYLPSHPIKYISWPRKSAYLRELESALEKMPFIYRDLDTDVLNYFVDITSQPLDVDTLSEKRNHLGEKVGYGMIELNERLKVAKRALFLGNAGIGKSTFQRYAVLKIIKDKSKAEFLNPNEDPVPFFVPLKVVDNWRPNPILHHLLERTSLLAEKRGLETLINLANQQRLFLFLDGYDELQFTGAIDGRNFVREELDIMMRARPFSGSAALPKTPTFNDFYYSLANCRIWLSSRKAFFAQYPVRLGDLVKSPGVYVLELHGIGNNRINLVRNIFNRYRQNSVLRKLFDEKYFIQQLDEAPDDELRKMSENPLWLTVLCYIYARKVIDKKDFQIQAASSFYELIDECLVLLLKDLDEYKVRELPEPERLALSTDRNRYIKEKTDFLEYFAAQLFCAEETIKSVFDFEYLQGKVRSYFEVHPDSSPNKDQILNTLKELGNSNFARQLINSGIFVLVDKKTAKEVFDFPHMRFREVLASEYFNKYSFSFLVDNLKKQGLSELLYVFFNRSKNQDAILKALLKAVTERPDEESYQLLVLNCLRQAPADYDPTKVLQTFFEHCIENNLEFRLPHEVLTHFNFDDAVSQMVTKGFRQSIIEDKVVSLFLCCSLLLRFNQQLLQELASTLITALAGRRIIAIQAVLAFPELYDFVKKCRDRADFIDHFVYLKDNFSALEVANNGIPYAKDDMTSECFLMTNEVIQAVQNYVRRMGSPSDDRIKSDLGPHKLLVQFTSDYLKPTDLQFDRSARRIAIKLSAIDYQIYYKCMKTIEGFSHSSLSKMRFFHRQAYIHEPKENPSSPRTLPPIIDESKPVTLRIGGHTLTLGFQDLTSSYNVTQSLVSSGIYISVLIRLRIETDRIVFDVTIYDDKRNTLCSISKNEWKFNPHGIYDRNYDLNSLEIVDHECMPIFQIQVKGSNEVTVSGYQPKEVKFDVYTDEAVLKGIDKKKMKENLRPIFTYPSFGSLGKGSTDR